MRRSLLAALLTTRARWTTHATSSRCSVLTIVRTRRRAVLLTKGSSIGGPKASRSRRSDARTGKVTRPARCTRCTTLSRRSSSQSSTPTSCRCPTSCCAASPSSRTRTLASSRAGGPMRTPMSRCFAATRRSASTRISSASSTRASRRATFLTSTAQAACGARHAWTRPAGGTRARWSRTWTSRCALSSRAGSSSGGTTSWLRTRSRLTIRRTASSSDAGLAARCSSGLSRALLSSSPPSRLCTRPT
mmetsp:Transcript_9014/g.15334  ORF Transcript_9014/g.15334 Transcript_9014/m.15334 type:complete len:247 (+) Transcript_9014:158-898(+)